MYKRQDLIDDQEQTIDFTVSAWMKLKSLRFNSNAEITINSVIVKKNNFKYTALDSGLIVSGQSPLLLSDLSNKVLGMN